MRKQAVRACQGSHVGIVTSSFALPFNMCVFRVEVFLRLAAMLARMEQHAPANGNKNAPVGFEHL